MSEDPSRETQAPPPPDSQRVLNSQAADALLGKGVRVRPDRRARQTLKSAGLVLAACGTTAITTAVLDRHQPAASQQSARSPVHAAPTPRYPRLSAAGPPNTRKPRQHKGFQGIRRAHTPTQPTVRTESTPVIGQPATAPEPPPASPLPPPPSPPATAGEEQTKGGPFSP